MYAIRSYYALQSARLNHNNTKHQTSMLKPFYFTLLLGGLFSWCASAKNNKPKNEEPVQKSINIGAHLVGGSEIRNNFV